MKFEQLPNRRRVATFEFYTDLEMHEQAVACNALGTLTARYRDSSARRLPSAQLGLRIARLQSQRHEGEETIRVSATMPILKREAQVLYNALEVYINDTGAAIHQVFSYGNVHGGNIRAVEGNMAEAMQTVIGLEFSLKPVGLAVPFGFR